MTILYCGTLRRTALSAAMSMALAGSLAAATIQVNDAGEFPVAGKCTALDAVAALNSRVAVNACLAGDGNDDTIDFSFFTAPSTISFSTLPAGGMSALVLTRPATLRGPLDGSGNPLVTIARNTAAGTPNFRVLESSQDLSLQGLAISGGVAADNGGGVFVSDHGNLAIDRSVISGNTAATSGGGAATNCGVVTLTGSRVSGNTAGRNGGGIYTAVAEYSLHNGRCFGDVTAVRSVVSGNTATTGNGAGIYMFKGYLITDHVTVDSNTAQAGSAGGIFTYGVVLLAATSVSGNTSHGDGGGLNARLSSVYDSTLANNTSVAGKGGAIYTDNYFRLINSTVNGNSAVNGGASSALTAKVTASTISGNHATVSHDGLWFPASGAGMSAYSSILTGNGSDDIAAAQAFSMGASSSGNIIGHLSNVTAPAGTLNCDAKLGTLADNGGPTKTMALGSGSCAIDAATPTPITLGSDQRGNAFARKVGSKADIGAFETQAAGERIFYGGFETGTGPGFFQ